MTTLPPIGGVHCGLRITRPAAEIVLVLLVGSDIGEFGDLPMQEVFDELLAQSARIAKAA